MPPTIQARPWKKWYAAAFQALIGLIPFVWWGSNKPLPSFCAYVCYVGLGALFHARKRKDSLVSGALWIGGAFSLFFIYVVVFVVMFAAKLPASHR
jgi:hypothetical protein